MDIQWIIIARQFEQSAITKNISIIEVIDQFTVNEINQPSFDVIAKVNYSLTEASESKRITLEISHDKNGELRTIEEIYQVPDLDTLVNRTTFRVYRLIDIEFPYTGKYTFTIYIDGEYKNEESIDVIKGVNL